MPILKISPKALDDLAEIKQYIKSELQSEQSANKVIRVILDKMNGLIQFPLACQKLSSIIEIDTDYRFLVCNSYIAFYRFEDEIIFVDRVLYGRRDYLKILFDN